MLEVVDVTKKFGNRVVLNSVSLNVRKGEIRVIIGVNGSGKSTLLKIIAGILKADSGAVRVNGEDITNLPPEDRRVGYVPQHPALFNHLNVEENIKYSLKNGRGSEDIFVKIVEMLKLESFLKMMPNELSGGYKSRVSLARALFSQPSVMLLDEPLSDVDLANKEELLPEFRRILKTMNVPVLYVTHDSWEAEMIGDTFSIMANGVIRDAESASKAFEVIRSTRLIKT